jgi:hypothetical protein
MLFPVLFLWFGHALPTTATTGNDGWGKHEVLAEKGQAGAAAPLAASTAGNTPYIYVKKYAAELFSAIMQPFVKTDKDPLKWIIKPGKAKAGNAFANGEVNGQPVNPSAITGTAALPGADGCFFITPNA